ncbi:MULTISPECIES: DUF5753 domain-containing protein [unclassified Crossiella]|uniref:DUF5753 domain-containing protein n=1 Tax=unclassified Crossiella TaxID=2620835 RepID=UPI001FFEE72E|nr:MULTISPECIES: DUF5753 domain-containing protein [unclassified Crossiella]MCK2237416.1 DUF5753 domain-containing protein [Crossiella sp. S99.2]MCK2251071.1 DUF5753 domain-containing protein [Crossiella sp. S99.1]
MTEQLQLPSAVLKILLGRLLARLRDTAGVKQDEVAKLLNLTQQGIALIESGMGVKPRYLDKLLEFYRAGAADQAYARNLQAESGRRRPKGSFATRFPQHVQLLIDMEGSCQKYFSYRTLTIPGLLQTAALMRENAESVRPALPADVIEKSVSDRLERQPVLDNLHQRFWFLVDESALHRIKDRVVQRAQIAQLVETMDRPNVELRVVPWRAGYYMGQGHDYTIFRYDAEPAVDIVYLEHHDDNGEYVKGDRVSRYQTLWEQQIDAAHAKAEQTRQTLVDLAKSL